MAFPALMASAAVMGAVSSWVKGTNQAALYNTQARELELQARLADQRGQAEIRNYERASAYRLGSILSAQGASGVDVFSGSPMEVRLAQARADGISKLNIQTDTAIRVRNLQYQSQLADFQRSVANRQRFFDMIGGAMTYASPFVTAGGFGGTTPPPGTPASSAASEEATFRMRG